MKQETKKLLIDEGLMVEDESTVIRLSEIKSDTYKEKRNKFLDIYNEFISDDWGINNNGNIVILS